MRLLDISFVSPEENLALDEVLLEGAETGRVDETLRFWESASPFVVLGVAQALRNCVREKECRQYGIPVLRRCSAGGCVLQGPGCLNYSLVLRHENHPETRTIRGSYCYILGRVAEAFRKQGLAVRHMGVSDLAWRGKKVSGNAQKRRKHCFLHHGTLVYGLDPDAMERYLREPEAADRPQYRGHRTHRGFMCNLPLDTGQLRTVILEAFGVDGPPRPLHRWEIKEARTLAREKYGALEWTHRR
jgi:lipoate-protein ligase A